MYSPAQESGRVHYTGLHYLLYFVESLDLRKKGKKSLIENAPDADLRTDCARAKCMFLV